MSNGQTLGVTPEQLIKAIQGELEARWYYTKLRKLAPNEKEAEIISHFFEDESQHYRNFYVLYQRITGEKPVIPPLKQPTFTTYIEGIEQAILDELDAYEFYRDIYLCSSNQTVKNVCFKALTDENEHAAHLNYLLTINRTD